MPEEVIIFAVQAGDAPQGVVPSFHGASVIIDLVDGVAGIPQRGCLECRPRGSENA